MSQEVLAKALDPFFTTKSIGRGSGMGLPQAYGFARQTGGTLVLHSTQGVGTSATLYLPMADDSPKIAGQDRHAQVPPTSSGSVLFVEDDTLVRDVMRPALESAGFQVTVATNGEEALAMLEVGTHFDLVFSDIVMPGPVSGIDLAEIVLKRFPQVRVILTTGYSDRRIALPGVQVLAKPYEIADIVNALNGALQSKAGPGETAMRDDSGPGS